MDFVLTRLQPVREATPDMWAVLTFAGLLWMCAYILIIKRGFQDKVCGMPLLALGANFAWEFNFAFIDPHAPPQVYTNLCWVLFDAVIVYQYLAYGKKEFPAALPRALFHLSFVLVMVLGFIYVLFVTKTFDDPASTWRGTPAAYGQNLLMSILFIRMLYRRQDLAGQSIYIGIARLFGTGLVSIVFHMLFPYSAPMNFAYVAIAAIDIAYVVLYYRKARRLGLPVWSRF
jgi:hypothetical protein